MFHLLQMDVGSRHKQLPWLGMVFPTQVVMTWGMVGGIGPPPHLQEGFGNFALLNCDVSIHQAALQELLQRNGKISGMIV